jgi:hypothetical protein
MLQKADAFVDPKRDLSSNSSMNQPIKRIETSISCTKVRLCTEVDQIKRVLPKIDQQNMKTVAFYLCGTKSFLFISLF